LRMISVLSFAAAPAGAARKMIALT
jgi:hypothetical protein